MMRPTHAATTRRYFVRGGLALGASFGARPGLAQQDEYGDAALRGAGSTLVQPLMDTWVHQYRRDPYQVLRRVAPGGGLDNELSTDTLDYEPVGSLAGIQRIRAGFVDFAASEMPLGGDYLKRSGLMQFPWVLGGVAVVTTAATSAQLRLDATTLAAIYLGRITRWSDPAIAALNPDVAIKDGPITALHRRDGSGTTFTFAHYLAVNDAEWRQRMGADLVLKWSGGKPVRGNDGMLSALQTTTGAIGYVNASIARTAGLPTAALRNVAGRYVTPEPAAIAAAVQAPREGADDLARLPIDAPGGASYPLVATVFGVLRTSSGTARQRRTLEFVHWTLTRGGALAHQLGYVSLPEGMTKMTLDRIGRPA